MEFSHLVYSAPRIYEICFTKRLQYWSFQSHTTVYQTASVFTDKIRYCKSHKIPTWNLHFPLRLCIITNMNCITVHEIQGPPGVTHNRNIVLNYNPACLIQHVNFKAHICNTLVWNIALSKCKLFHYDIWSV